MFPDWTGQSVVIVASGPSAADVPLHMARGRMPVMAVKDGWRLCPWADVLYGCDHHWWEAHRGVMEFAGLRMAYDSKTLQKWPSLPWLKVEIKKPRAEFLFGQVGHVGWGGNSGFHAINLALQFGAKRLLLIGFDMRVDKGKHFFGNHKYTKDRPSQANAHRWAEILDAQAPVVAARGVEIINCSLVSALKAYPKMAFEQALGLVLDPGMKEKKNGMGEVQP